MMKSAKALILLFPIVVILIKCEFCASKKWNETMRELNYYWRDYDGRIPIDALIAGTAISGATVHIGQAYLHNVGIFPVELFRGQMKVYVPNVGKIAYDYIKILCGPKHKFKWIPTDSEHIDRFPFSTDKYVSVKGGHHQGHGILYVGRTATNGTVHVGKINSFGVEEHTKLWSFFDGVKYENGFTDFEVLVYVLNDTVATYQP